MLGAGDIIQQYRAFVSVAEQKSLTRAAEILGYTQSG
ncbi:MAG: LysR family transcriptional regulator, partial [Oscillospiraceae bacterium]|nr:LysR family transcriptional regulator [Oscillospiraceae bacterium]